MNIFKKIPLGVYIVLITATIAFAAAGVGFSTWTSLTTIATGDLLGVTDVSNTTDSDNGTSSAITWGNLMAAPGAIGGTTPAAGAFTTLSSTSALSVAQGADPDYIELREGTTFDGTYKHTLTTVDLSADRETEFGDYDSALLASDQVDSGGDLADGAVDKAHLASNVFEDTAGVDAGTATDEAITADALAGSNAFKKDVCWTIFDADEDTAELTGVQAYTVPSSLNGMDLVDVVASVHTKGVTGTLDIQVRRRRAGSDVNVLTTMITLGDEYFASDESVNTSNDRVITGDQIYIDVDAIHSGTAAKGLSVSLLFRLP